MRTLQQHLRNAISKHLNTIDKSTQMALEIWAQIYEVIVPIPKLS